MIHVILGTKAQLIKMAPVMVRMNQRGLPYRFIYTGQHRATMDEMLDEFELKKPDVVLYDGADIVSVPQMLFWVLRILGRTAIGRRSIFGNDRGGIVLVHGDTLSTLLGALMGRVAGLRVGHVESGLRSFNLLHPFPEELTRLITFRLSHTLYCPGQWAVDNVARLKREKVDTRSNTMSDSLAMALQMGRRRDHVPDQPFGLVSLHRYENIFRREVFEALIGHVEAIAQHRLLLCVMHPPTDRQLRRYGFYDRLDRNPKIELRPRYTYFDFVSLMEAADFVITDGGSIQEESSYLGIPCLLMRGATEREEGLGRNVVLSRYDPRIINDFVKGFQRYRSPPVSDQLCPSDIIIDSAMQYA
ncbi:MAG: UDP-N-acetylglucosamine 2-epimerase [Thermoanaerobaculia bacterium]